MKERLIFQSTLPVRGATHAPEQANAYADISIHAPREGSDVGHLAPPPPAFRFQSTLPVRGATR